MKTNDIIRNAEILVKFTGYGHWKISCLCYGKRHSITTTDSQQIDNFHDDDDRRSNSAALILIKRIRRDYKLNK